MKRDLKKMTCSTSPPAEIQVDGLPPVFYIIIRGAEILPAKRVILTLGEVAWARDRAHL